MKIVGTKCETRDGAVNHADLIRRQSDKCTPKKERPTFNQKINQLEKKNVRQHDRADGGGVRRQIQSAVAVVAYLVHWATKMGPCFVAFLLGLVLCLTGSLSNAQTVSETTPPVNFKSMLKSINLPTPPPGFVWQRIEAIEVAVLTPKDWKKYQKEGSFQKVFAFSNESLDEKGFFETGLTVKLWWHQQAAPGNEAKAVESILAGIVHGIESNKVDNKVLRGTLEEMSDKKKLIVRYRNAPKGLTPIIVYSVSIGDPKTGLVYQFIFEGQEAQWDEKWKIGMKILNQLIILFQRS